MGKRKTTEEFIKDAVKIHGDKYDYSEVNYTNNKTKVKIICPIHGEFWQTPHIHLKNRGCYYCGRIKTETSRQKGLSKFIEEAKNIHGDKYDYSLINKIYVKDNLPIICKIHGVFYQRGDHHLSGCGCPKCKDSSLEKEMGKFLNDNNIKFEEQKTFDWLKYKDNMFLDFYLPDYNVAIECQGEQHFHPVNHFGGENIFKQTKERDITKEQLCKNHNIKILYYSNLHIEYPYMVFENMKKLLEEILRNNGNQQDI